MKPELLFLIQAAPDGRRQLYTMLWYLLGFGLIFYFFFIRPQSQKQKKHRERVERIKRGDEIVTSGGIIAEVVHVKDDRLTVKSAESRFVVERERIAVVRSPGEEPEAQKK